MYLLSSHAAVLMHLHNSYKRIRIGSSDNKKIQSLYLCASPVDLISIYLIKYGRVSQEKDITACPVELISVLVNCVHKES